MKRMHRWIAWMLVLALTCGLMPMSVLANTTEQTEASVTVHVDFDEWINPVYEGVVELKDVEFYDFLEQDAGVSAVAEEDYLSEDQAVGEMRQHLKNREEVFTIRVASDNSDYWAVRNSIRDGALTHTGEPTEGDYIRWHLYNIETSLSYYRIGEVYYYAYTFAITYHSNAAQEAEVDAAVEALLSELDLDGKSDYEKIRAIYDYMCANITYDYDSPGTLKHTAYAALVNKTAVCQGYASLLYRLLLEVDVDNRIITGIGNGGGHAWNIIELDDLYYDADATWDAIWHQAGLDYNYFLRNEDNFTENGTDHFRYEEYDTAAFWEAYPMSETDYSPILAQGTCGDNLTWVLNKDNVLTISGNGAMTNFNSGSDAPWAEYIDDIETVVIGPGVTGIGSYAFSDCEELEEIIFEGNAPSIGTNAFDNVEATVHYPVGDDTWTEDVMQQYGGNITWEVNCDHNWQPASCTTPQTCSICGTTEGETLNHSYENGFCTMCDGYEPAVRNYGTYEISNAGQLYWFAQQVNQGATIINGKLMADIVVNGNLMDKITIDASGNATVNDGCTVRTWTPIGNSSQKYTGTFEGNGKSVSGLYYYKPGMNYVGLFGNVGRGGIVQNVSVVNSYLGGNRYVGGIVGRNVDGTIENCRNSSTVTGNEYVGGIVGYNDSKNTTGSITTSYNTGTINGAKWVGGVAGGNFGTVRNCYNTGSVTGASSVGGVAGSNTEIITNCYNVGTVNGATDIGGVVGWSTSVVNNCYYLESACDGGIAGEDVTGKAEARTEAQFASGQVAYLLQSGQTASVWGQKIGTDASPVFSDAEVFYHAENNIYFNADTQGDLNMDGVANSEDLTLLARHVGRIESLEGQALLNADVNGDGEVDAEDLTKHARYVGRIISSWDQE